MTESFMLDRPAANSSQEITILRSVDVAFCKVWKQVLRRRIEPVVVNIKGAQV